MGFWGDVVKYPDRACMYMYGSVLGIVRTVAVVSKARMSELPLTSLAEAKSKLICAKWHGHRVQEARRAPCTYLGRYVAFFACLHRCLNGAGRCTLPTCTWYVMFELVFLRSSHLIRYDTIQKCLPLRMSSVSNSGTSVKPLYP